MSNEQKIDCCVLVADGIKLNYNYGKAENAYTFSYNYSVPVPKIEEAKKFIEETFRYFGQPCSRVYISGFIIQPESSVWTKEKIVEQVKNETTRMNNLLQEKYNAKAR